MDTDVILAVGTAPHTDSYDMDVLMQFIKSQKPQKFEVYLFDPRWKEVGKIYFNMEDEAWNRTTFLYSSDEIPFELPFEHATETTAEQRRRQASVREMKTLEAFGNTCPIKEGSVWEQLNYMMSENRETTLYIYNCAWWSRAVGQGEPELKQNSYFENMCGLANLFATHPNAFILTNGKYDFNVFSQPEAITKDLSRIPKPGRFKQPRGGRRKRTQKGLKKRRATRRWKHRS
jgi:hypothetical protein